MIWLIACAPDKSKNIPDVSGIEPDWSLVRFERELLQLDSADGRVLTEPLFTRYPVFAPLYFQDILGLRSGGDSLNLIAGELLANPGFRKWLDTCSNVFGDMNGIQQELKQALQFYEYYFPERSTPRVYTLVSEFSVGNFIFQDADGRDGLGIGLDFFLGPEFPYTAMAHEFPAFSQYLSRSFTPDHLTRKSIAVLVDDMAAQFPPSNLLDAMIAEGIRMYVLEKLIPFAHDTVLWEFTPEQWEWVRENEVEMWQHFLNEKLLYSTDRTLIQKLTLAGPNSPGMPLEAPGRSAVYTGYRIVQSYHRRNPDFSLRELLELNDARKILTEARYRP